MKNLIRLAMLVVMCGCIFAQGAFVINTYMDSTQRDPQIDRDAVGNYAVVWNSDFQVSPISQGDIYLQLFNSNDEKTGSEQLVNTYTDLDQEKPALAMSGNGDFIIAWGSFTDLSSSYDVKARLYKNFVPQGDDFLVNTTADYSQTNPECAIDESGNFIIAWESWYQDGSNRGIYAQRFDSGGNKVGAEFRINSTTLFSQARPAVKYFSNGNFIIVWESWKQDIVTPSGYGVFGKIFDANGTTLKEEFQINTYTNDYQWFGDVETFNDNSFIVVWCSWEQDGYDGGIYLQKFDTSGNKAGDETMVNKTTVYYQWLPRISKLNNNNFAVVWSSWKTDGSREGIYAQIFSRDLDRVSFETRVNDYTDSFQWEPDLIPGTNNEILVVWSNWGQYDKDYEVVGKRITPFGPQAAILQNTYQHTGGISTTKLAIHVIDSTQITGDTYQVTFEVPGTNTYYANIKNLTTGADVVTGFGLNAGEDVFYLTNSFGGVAAEFVPTFEMRLDLQNSQFINHSATNVIFILGKPTSGISVLAPIDIIVIWGSPDTLADGSYANPLDTAYSVAGLKEIELPFRAWNLTDNEKTDMFIPEPVVSKNKRWDPGETIVFLTPEQYQTTFPNFHAQLTSSFPAGNLIYPNIGDTNMVLTKKPLTENDVFTFQTKSEYITTGLKNKNNYIGTFALKQNYPNPFNPTTTIAYSIPRTGLVKFTVYGLLGQRISVLVNEIKNPGSYKILFDGGSFASGVYLYTIEFENKFISKKMLLLK